MPPDSIDLPWPSRRTVLTGAAAGAVTLIAGPGLPAVAVPTGSKRARFLSPARLALLGAVVDRIVPDEDGTPGALAARCHEGIDALLGAFTVSPPRIYAGGPWSDRGGSRTNHFARFVPLDAYEQRAWRGHVRRFQQVYVAGLDALAATAPGFATLPAPARDVALRTNRDPKVAALMSMVVPHTFQTCWGAPEYGGNRAGQGWQAIGFDGDRQPRGYTRTEVTDPPLEPLPVMDVKRAMAAYGPALTLATSEASMGLLAEADGDFAVLTERVRALLAGAEEAL